MLLDCVCAVAAGFTYDTSDVAALEYRLNSDKADWIVYVVDSGQSSHFKLLFGGAQRAGILDPKKHRCVVSASVMSANALSVSARAASGP